jgi:hypothetical protein
LSLVTPMSFRGRKLAKKEGLKVDFSFGFDRMVVSP